MKTFKDLEWSSPPKEGQAILNFNNGYGVSVITYGYHTIYRPYELAVLKNHVICYDTPITESVLGYITAREVTKYMKKVQLLERSKKC